MPIITDGAWGTQLQAAGLAPGECPEAWNLTRPAVVQAVAAAYVAAGSKVILTNTFGANAVVLARHGLADQVTAINQAGAALSRAAAGSGVQVYASVGPVGRLLSAGEITPAEVRAAFHEQIAALQAGGADGIVAETMADGDEAAIAAEVANELGLPVVLSFTFDHGKAHDRTMCGLTPERAARIADEAGADGLGANCGLGAEALLPVMQRLRAASTLPLWAKPNAGLPVLAGGVTVYRSDPLAFAEHSRALVGAGAYWIGACCGSSPAVIAALQSSP